MRAALIARSAVEQQSEPEGELPWMEEPYTFRGTEFDWRPFGGLVLALGFLAWLAGRVQRSSQLVSTRLSRLANALAAVSPEAPGSR